MLKKLFRTLAIVATVASASIIATLAPAAAGIKGEVVKEGHFKGKNGKTVTGKVSIVKTKDGYVAVVDNFSLSGAPDPSFAFGKNGKYVKSSDFVKLTKIKGKQVHKIPSHINPEEFTDFFLWCEKFSVTLGIAKFK